MCIISDGFKESTGNRPDLPDCRTAAELAQAQQVDLMRTCIDRAFAPLISPPAPVVKTFGGDLVKVIITRRASGNYRVEVEVESMDIFIDRLFEDDEYDAQAAANEWASDIGPWLGNLAIANKKFNDQLKATAKRNKAEWEVR